MNTQKQKMKQVNRFKKHSKWVFVFIPVIIILSIVILVIIESNVIAIYFAAAAGVILWVLLSIYLLNKTQNEIKKIVSILLNIEKDNIIPNALDFNEIFKDVKTPLEGISDKMQKQQEELQKEKLQRLRSVIDGQDQERNRLSRELHDGLGQSLIAIKLQLENAETLPYSQMRAGIDAAKNRIDITLEEVRRICNALLPAELNEFGIVSTLRARCDEMAALAGFKVTFESEGSLERIDKKTKIYLYRIAQETLNNIAKHAKATHVKMRISRNLSIITLEVKDNGKGFNFDPLNFAQRNGLQNMRERVNLLNGNFELISVPGKGTQVNISVPYRTSDGKD